MRVSSRIKAALAAREMTAADLAAALGVTPGAVSQRMRGDEWPVGGRTGLIAVGDALGIDAGLLELGGREFWRALGEAVRP